MTIGYSPSSGWARSAICNRRLYDQPRQTIAAALLQIIGLPNLKIVNKRIYDRVFALYTSSAIDFIDACHAATMEDRGQPDILSFDTGFDRLPGIIRHTAVK